MLASFFINEKLKNHQSMCEQRIRARYWTHQSVLYHFVMSYFSIHFEYYVKISKKMSLFRTFTKSNFFIRLFKEIRLICMFDVTSLWKKWEKIEKKRERDRKFNKVKEKSHFTLNVSIERNVLPMKIGVSSASIDFIEKIGLMELIFGLYNHDFMIASNICKCPSIFVCLTETSRTWEARFDVRWDFVNGSVIETKSHLALKGYVYLCTHIHWAIVPRRPVNPENQYFQWMNFCRDMYLLMLMNCSMYVVCPRIHTHTRTHTRISIYTKWNPKQPNERIECLRNVNNESFHCDYVILETQT